ncbi:hypothetical protein [Streptomyces sp. SID8352]|uniref:DUF6197 family protein n=1 Tax=Streptomyces sp. SID8352 TaxID=2690338 RepID=UPI00136E744E|nr:hypothetical protein [Streptomyces sp. SID8352]MYU26381.1 hypothetical protein [Streptomyces sp. SID8352]
MSSRTGRPPPSTRPRPPPFSGAPASGRNGTAGARAPPPAGTAPAASTGLDAEATGTAELHDALAVLLETVRRGFPDETVPAFNDAHGRHDAFHTLDQAADLAHARRVREPRTRQPSS